MPLVSELTTELRKWLTPQKLRELNASWRQRGGGYADVVVEDFVSVLTREDQHYESLLGYLEVQFKRESNLGDDYHALYSWLVQLVYYLLYYRHLNNVGYIKRQIGNYVGLTALMDENHPLWVFSLNHDVLVECIAITNGLPLSAGFTEEQIFLQRRMQPDGATLEPLRAEVLPAPNIDSLGMPFLPMGQRGINLLKIHGSLDTFTFRDGQDLLRILPLENTVDGVMESLRAVNEEIWHPSSTHVRPINEIAYADEAGEMQFLRRSLLAGAFKYDRRHNQVLPYQLLGHFRTHLSLVTTLVAIGYSFGDDHANDIIREWLEFRSNRRLVVVGPSAHAVPARFKHLAPQVDLSACSATDYLDSHAGIQRSTTETNHKKVTAYFRHSGKDATSELVSASRELANAKVQKWLNAHRKVDGSLDRESLSASRPELFKEVRSLAPSTDELLEEFVKARAL